MDYNLRKKLLLLESDIINKREIKITEDIKPYLFLENSKVTGINWVKLKRDWAIWCK